MHALLLLSIHKMASLSQSNRMYGKQAFPEHAKGRSDLDYQSQALYLLFNLNDFWVKSITRLASNGFSAVCCWKRSEYMSFMSILMPAYQGASRLC